MGEFEDAVNDAIEGEDSDEDRRYKDAEHRFVKSWKDDREGLTLKCYYPPPGSQGAGYDVLVHWEDGSLEWQDAGDLEWYTGPFAGDL